MLVEFKPRKSPKIPTEPGKSHLYQIMGTSDEPVYRQGSHVLVALQEAVKVRDHVAVKLRNGRNLVAVYAGEQDGQHYFHRFAGHPTVQHIETTEVVSLSKIVAWFSPGFIA